MVKYRTYAREAARCVFRLTTLRPCDTDFDNKMKSKITAKLLAKNVRLGKFVYNHFTLISLIFVIIMFLSLGYTIYSVYNLVVYGSCDPHSDECVFTPHEPQCIKQYNYNVCNGCDCNNNCDCGDVYT